ncbi:hypothetical protein BC629DRAFT_1480037 [Irpex lacteus]|nr:hypothetical protein BC629DRAFT_1480037 [Irpex lacteus]
MPCWITVVRELVDILCHSRTVSWRLNIIYEQKRWAKYAPPAAVNVNARKCHLLQSDSNAIHMVCFILHKPSWISLGTCTVYSVRAMRHKPSTNSKHGCLLRKIRACHTLSRPL